MMMHVPISRADVGYDFNGLVTAAARCWRGARDGCKPIQQALYSTLATYDCGMLAPVFDSLLTLCEAALGRKIAVGDVTISKDEHLLLSLLEGTMPRRTCVDCTAGAGRALDCAICSTRIMLSLELGSSPRRRPSML